MTNDDKKLIRTLVTKEIERRIKNRKMFLNIDPTARIGGKHSEDAYRGKVIKQLRDALKAL